MVDFKVILGVFGNITAICLFTSPIPTFIDIVKKRSVGDYSGIPYVCTLLNCLLWVVYGLPVVEFQVLVVSINAAGVLIEITYLVLYLMNANRKIKMKVLKILVPVLVAFVMMTVLVLELVHEHKKRKLIVGTLCAVFAVGMYISPLTVMKMVIRTRSVEYMPFLLSLFNFINGLVWTGYAFIGGVDIFIAIPNGLGALSGVAQLALYAFYRNATPRPDMETDEKGHPVKPSNSVFVEMEKHGALPKHEANGAP
jgi:solute carrier family 50 protein (sugar transporter)